MAVPFAAWTLLELLSVAAALWLLARSTPLAPTARWLAIPGALAYQPLHALLLTGQSSTLVLLGLVGLYAALKADRQGWAGVALALLLIKPQLALPILLLLLLSRAWRPLLIAGAIHAALAVAVMPLLGIAWPLSYLRYLAGSRHWDHRMFEHAPLMHNWRSLAAHLIEPVAPALASPAVTLLTALSVALLAWAWWRQRPNFHQPPPSIGGPRIALTDLLWALATIVTILIAHHLYIHDLTLLIFPAWLLSSPVPLPPAGPTPASGSPSPPSAASSPSSPPPSPSASGKSPSPASPSSPPPPSPSPGPSSTSPGRADPARPARDPSRRAPAVICGVQHGLYRSAAAPAAFTPATLAEIARRYGCRAWAD
ncbi:MAG: glycosyltransferase family 87 protein [Chloroflexia bacterium]